MSTKSLKPPKGLSDYVGVRPQRAYAIPDPGGRGPLRFISASASRQHPIKRDAGYIYADAVVRAPRLLGVCDGVSGVQQLGLKPDELPRQLLEQCSKAMDHCIAAGEVPSDGDGHWLMTLLQEAYDQTVAWGATTVLLAAMEDSRRLVVANVGDCGLLVLRPAPSCPSGLAKEFRTEALRYEANKPVQVMRLGNSIAAETHLVIQGARMSTVQCRRGDFVVLGSDGIFDNLRDEEIGRIVESHCMASDTENAFPACNRPDVAWLDAEKPPPTPSVRQLEQAARALVDAAISNVRVEQAEDAAEEPHWEASRREKPGGNADDTTAIVAVVVEADDLVKASQEESHQVPRPSFRVGSRRIAAAPADGTRSVASWAAGGILGISGIIPQCCKTHADRGEEFEEYLMCKEVKKPACMEPEEEQPDDDPEQCVIS